MVCLSGAHEMVLGGDSSERIEPFEGVQRVQWPSGGAETTPGRKFCREGGSRLARTGPSRGAKTEMLFPDLSGLWRSCGSRLRRQV